VIVAHVVSSRPDSLTIRDATRREKASRGNLVQMRLRYCQLERKVVLHACTREQCLRLASWLDSATGRTCLARMVLRLQQPDLAILPATSHDT
jgi:hypothetical protein